MHIVKKTSAVRSIVRREKARGTKIGFVPTMGYLHEGHLSLVRLAHRRSQFIVVSIFVNPMQFGPKEDLARYPRDLPRDLQLLRQEHVDLVFCPNVRELYPPGYRTAVEVQNLSAVLCGLTRPNHFRGVTTIVLKLLNIVEPDIAVFGQKDFQQAIIIKRMIKDLNLNVDIIVGKTIREKDGLAMSSRNNYLSKAERTEAVVLYNSLQWIRQTYRKGLTDPGRALRAMRRMIDKSTGRVDYIAFVDPQTLMPVRKLKKGTLIALAVYFGTTRLIDNTVL